MGFPGKFPPRIAFGDLSLQSMPYIAAACLLLLVVSLGSPSGPAAASIETIQGVIVEVGEGFLWLKPQDGSQARKFILRWKARFDPPKLPMKGDHAVILFKSKQEGAVIYGVRYLEMLPEQEFPERQENR